VLKIATSVQQAMAVASNKAGRQLDFTARISDELFRRVSDLASELSEESNGFSAGFLTLSDAISFEAVTPSMKIMTKRFQCDVQVAESGEVRPGPFLEVVIANLKLGRTYNYLLCCQTNDWMAEVNKFREILRLNEVTEEEQAQINFRISPRELICSACLHDLDLEQATSSLPSLMERYRDFVDGDGSLAYISVQNELAEGGLVLEPLYRDSVVRFFGEMWSGGARV